MTGDTSSAAPKGESLAFISLLSATASTSHQAKIGDGGEDAGRHPHAAAVNGGDASGHGHAGASGHHAAARTTTVALVMGSLPSPAATVAPVMAIFWAAAGMAVRAMAGGCKSQEAFISRLLRPAGPARNR